MQSFPNRIFTRPKSLGSPLVDDYDCWRARAITVCDRTALHYRQLHCFEIPRHHDSVDCIECFARSWFGTPVDFQISIPKIARDRQVIDATGSLNTWECL